MLHEKFYRLLEEKAILDKELANKTDTKLVEELYYSSFFPDLPKNIIKTLTHFIDSGRLSKVGRKELENIYKLCYAERILEE